MDPSAPETFDTLHQTLNADTTQFTLEKQDVKIGFNCYSLAFMDDIFSYKYNHRLIFYKPYNEYFPSKQAMLLTLWYKVGLPHERHKQTFRPAIEIIGFWVDLRDMTIMMPTNSKLDLITAMRRFTDTTSSHMHPPVKWQQILGWINWGLNTFPLLQPSLQSSYEKIAS